MSSKQTKLVAPSCHPLLDHREECVAGERNRRSGEPSGIPSLDQLPGDPLDLRPLRGLGHPMQHGPQPSQDSPRLPQPTRVPGCHSLAPGTAATGGGPGPGRVHSCCRGAGWRISAEDRLARSRSARLSSVSRALSAPGTRRQREQAPAATGCARRSGRTAPSAPPPSRRCRWGLALGWF